MIRVHRLRLAHRCGIAALAVLLGACAIAPPRTDDPLQKFNRKMFAFNQFADKAVMRPVAKGYVKITTPGIRNSVGNFFTNLRSPITMINEVLQGRPGPALDTLARFMINSTAGVLGLFDPASRLDVPSHATDFGITLADWGVPQGPYLVLPLLGPTTVRDVWQYPVDTYADPMAWYTREHSLRWHAEYAPEVVYFVNLRAGVLPFDRLLDSAFDPYALMRDAYLQHRVNMIYHGNPPLAVFEHMEGTSPSGESQQSFEQLLKQQEQYEKTHGGAPGAGPASSAPPPASGGSAPPPAKPAATPAATGSSGG